MSGSGTASVGQVAAHAGKGQAQQHGKERPVYIFSAAPQHNPRVAGAEAMPEWKLNCICADYGLPPTVRGHLPMGGCF